MSIELAAIAYRERKNQPITFDGVWRPEPWLHEKRWCAVRYYTTGSGKAFTSHREMDSLYFDDEQRAQARCDQLNATRERVRHANQTPNSAERLL